MVVAQRITDPAGTEEATGCPRANNFNFAGARQEFKFTTLMAAFLNFINYSTLHLFSYGEPSITNGKSKEGMNRFKVSPISKIFELQKD